MSTFAVTVERIARVWAHPNADRLAMAQLASMTYQFVIPKDQYQAGDLVVYFPIDSLLPEPIIQRLGLEGKLSGSARNRIKTVRLRDQISQGVVAFPSLVGIEDAVHEGQDLTERLGVTKYEPPIIPSHAGNLVKLPAMVNVYDIEGAERHISAVELYLLETPVMISEKLEGSHFAASLLEDGTLAVSQRNHRIEPIEGKEHDWHKAARTSGILAALPQLKTALEAQGVTPIQVLTVRGELLGPGVQKNIYKLPDHTVYIFEIEVNGVPVDAATYQTLVTTYNLAHAPILSSGVTLREWLNGKTLAAASDGKSLLNPDVLREGIVVRPMTETRDGTLGRVILKQRSPEYLSGSDF